MRFASTRLGDLDIDEDAIIEFPSGLIGLGGSRYAIVATDEESSFRWLQSLDDPGLALPITNPFLFYEDYAVDLSDADTTRVGAEDAGSVDVWVIVRAAADPGATTVNLKAPIVIHNHRGHQVINEAAGADVRAPLFG